MSLFNRFKGREDMRGTKYEGLTDDEMQSQCDSLLRSGDFIEARAATSELVKRKPHDGYAWQMKALAFANGEIPDYLEAYNAISQALPIADCLFAYGMFLGDQIEFVYHLEDYESVVEGCQHWWDGYKKGNFEKNDYVVMYHALALRRIGRFDEGVSILDSYDAFTSEGKEALSQIKKELIDRITPEDSEFV